MMRRWQLLWSAKNIPIHSSMKDREIHAVKNKGGTESTCCKTFRHVPLEISMICHYSITHGGAVSRTVEGSKPHCLQESKLMLTFKSSGDLKDKLKNLPTRVSNESKIKMKMMKKSIFNSISILILITTFFMARL